LILQIFSIFDQAAGAFLPPWHAQTLEVALRRFRATVNAHHQESNPIAEYPEDYTLFHLGEFDQATGETRPLPTPHSLGVAVTFVESLTPSAPTTPDLEVS
jgi:hypothetical protein